MVIVATENDLVYGLDAETGHAVWRTALGQPARRSALPCGNIDPLGITGTPVIDAACGTVFLDAMVDDRGKPRHLVYGLRLSDGGVLPGFPIDVGAGLAARGIRFDATAQNQRGALAGYSSVINSLNNGASAIDVALSAGQSISDLLIQLKQKALAAALRN